MVAERNLPNEEETKKMSYLFQRWLITLGAQVYALQKSMASKDAQRLRREAASSEAELQALYDYAEQHQVNLLPYAASFTEIEGQLRLIYEHLREQQTHTES
jgi:hypothetical protein